ncbi:MAG: hypothetical protein QME51_08920 [Planctomycetota bacterium]|nr:hypothetical protein [Planctomycetota bacterium]MDI6788478.1 hypothetical protein [Planctomycetota bacterium]
MNKKRAMSSEKASFVKRQGHLDAREFAKLIGLRDDYRNDFTAKKDVIDKSGDSYSVKSGEKKWQIFLYGKTRFEQDYSFRAMNGIGQLLLECIECFPDSFSKYQKSKKLYKDKLQRPMTELCNKLKNKSRISAFIDKAMFNSGEVNYLVIKQEGKFYVYWSRDIVNILSENMIAENSQARTAGQEPNQKVVFKINNKTVGEIEMRNDSNVHYRQVKFWLNKKQIVALLFNEITEVKKHNDKVLVYGTAIKKFWRRKDILVREEPVPYLPVTSERNQKTIFPSKDEQIKLIEE